MNKIQVVRVVRNEQGRPDHRGRIHVVLRDKFSLHHMTETLCGLEMWVSQAEERDSDHLELCMICNRIVTNERFARIVTRLAG